MPHFCLLSMIFPTIIDNITYVFFFQINTLLEYYRQLAQKEKAEKEKKKYIRRRSYLHYSVSDV